MTEDALAEPSEFSFFQLATLLEHFFPDAPPLGAAYGAAAERVRFGAVSSMGFPAADIAGIAWDHRGDRRAGGAADLLRVTVTFLGLYGPSSPLPDFHTERVLHDDDLDYSLRDFYNLFNHRLTALLYQCWTKYRYYLQFRADGRDDLSLAVLALAGVQHGAADGEAPVEWVRLLSYAGLLGFNSCPPDILARLIGHYLGVPARVEEGIERRVTILPEQRNRLGQQGSMLGFDWVLGERVPDISGKFRLWIGPVTRAQFDSLAVGTVTNRVLFRLVRELSRDSLDFDIRVLVNAGEILPWSLGARPGHATAPLGQLCWLGNTAASSLGVCLQASAC